MLNGAAAAILAGGRGTRLGGVGKAFLEVGGRRIIDWQLDVLRPLFPEILVVTGEPGAWDNLGLRVEGDRFPGRGAPAGVHAALDATSSGWVFCLGCDMPFIQTAAIELLWNLRQPGDEIVAPVRRGYPEPLFAFYSRACRDRFAEALGRGNVSLMRLLGESRTRLVPEKELQKVDPWLASLENVNTPEDLERVKR